MPTIAEQPKLLSIPEVAHHLRVERSTVYRLIRAGKLKTTRAGTRTRVRSSELDRYIASQSQQTQDGAA